MIVDKDNIIAGPSICLQFAILNQKSFYGRIRTLLSFIIPKMDTCQYLGYILNINIIYFNQFRRRGLIMWLKPTGKQNIFYR